jgi:hypothetical protein
LLAEYLDSSLRLLSAICRIYSHRKIWWANIQTSGQITSLAINPQSKPSSNLLKVLLFSAGDYKGRCICQRKSWCGCHGGRSRCNHRSKRRTRW